jgi:hypothetical protein
MELLEIKIKNRTQVLFFIKIKILLKSLTLANYCAINKKAVKL